MIANVFGPSGPNPRLNFFGLTGIGSIGSVSCTPLGTVLTILSKRLAHVEKKKSCESGGPCKSAILLMTLPPSELKMRASDRVVSLCPKARGFCVLLRRNSRALDMLLAF